MVSHEAELRAMVNFFRRDARFCVSSKNPAGMKGAAPKVAVAVFVVVADVDTQDSCPALVWLRLYMMDQSHRKNRHGTLAYGGASRTARLPA